MKPQSVEGSDLTSRLFLIVPVLLIIIGVGLPSIYAELFGIDIDNTCKTMIRNNVSSTCPTFEDIITLFPDTSDQSVSGKFEYNNGYYHRGPTKLFDSIEYYRYWDKPVLFIDPPAEYRKSIKIIEIKANLDQYLMRGKTPSYNKTDHSITLGTHRFIDSCRLAYVDSDQWPLYVGDTIYHMEHGCSPDTTKIESTVRTQLNKTNHDIATSYKWKLAQWQKQAIERCGTKICLYEENKPAP